MRKKFLCILAGTMMMVGAMAFSAAPALAVDPDLPTSAEPSSTKCKSDVTLFGLDPWYTALDCDGKEIAQSNFQSGQLTTTIISIIGVVAKDLLFIAGFVAVGFVMYGGFLMVTSAGNPGSVEKAKKTISGAIIGLVISILAYAIATFVLSVAIGG